MAIAGRRPKCTYCGEMIPTVSDKPFDGRIYPDYRSHNKVCKHHPLNKQKMENNDTPRRIRIDLFTPAEKAIYDAMQEVEKMPPDTRLTEAVVLLYKAREKVADFVDGINNDVKPQ